LKAVALEHYGACFSDVYPNLSDGVAFLIIRAS
jgi:hypothetical protein